MSAETPTVSNPGEQSSSVIRSRQEGNLPERFMPSTQKLSLFFENYPDSPLPPIDFTRAETKNHDVVDYTKSTTSSSARVQQSYPEVHVEERAPAFSSTTEKFTQRTATVDDELHQSVLSLSRVTQENTDTLKELTLRLSKFDSQNYHIVEAINKIKEEVEALKMGKAKNHYEEEPKVQQPSQNAKGYQTTAVSEKETFKTAGLQSSYPSYQPSAEEGRPSLAGMRPSARAQDLNRSQTAPQLDASQSRTDNVKPDALTEGSIGFMGGYRAGDVSPSRAGQLHSASMAFNAPRERSTATYPAGGYSAQLNASAVQGSFGPQSGFGGETFMPSSTYHVPPALGGYNPPQMSSLPPPVITSIRISNDHRGHTGFAPQPSADFAASKSEFGYGAAAPTPFAQSFYHRHGFNAPRNTLPPSNGFRSSYHAAQPFTADKYSTYQSRLGQPAENYNVHEHKATSYSSYSTLNRSSSVPQKDGFFPESAFSRGIGHSQVGAPFAQFPERTQQIYSQPMDRRPLGGSESVHQHHHSLNRA